MKFNQENKSNFKFEVRNSVAKSIALIVIKNFKFSKSANIILIVLYNKKFQNVAFLLIPKLN